MARENRVFMIAFSVSLLFHLSMFTVFSIVIVFPKVDRAYYAFDLVDPRTGQPLLAHKRDLLRIPTPEDALEIRAEDPLEPPFESRLRDSLPTVELPIVEAAELERLSVRQAALEIRERYSELFEAKPQDSWARFGHELDRLGGALARLAFSPGETVEPSEEPPKLVSRPAPGFEVYVKWMSEPYEREPIFTPPIEVLSNVDAGALREPIALIFKVAPEGKVNEVLPPLDDEAGITASAARALFKYRFEPLPGPGQGDQRGTLWITAAGVEP
jgi:hypothetical protein